jgi:hypothetical protein
VGGAEEGKPLGTVRWIWAGALAITVVAVAVVILLARGTSSGAGAASSFGVRAALDRETVEFADPVTATVTVVLDRSSLGPADVHLTQSLAPLVQLGTTHVTHSTQDGLNVVTYTSRASCLDQRCIADKGGKTVSLRPAAVEVEGHSKQTAVWPVLQIRPRVSQADVAQPHPPLRADTTPPPVEYSVRPRTLALALEIAAAVLAAAGVLLAGWTAASLVRGRRRRLEGLTGLERALALAREAEQRPAPDRRRALGLLARLLGSREPQLAGAADELAWSAPPPTRDDLATLVAQVEQEVNGR